MENKIDQKTVFMSRFLSLHASGLLLAVTIVAFTGCRVPGPRLDDEIHLERSLSSIKDSSTKDILSTKTTVTCNDPRNDAGLLSGLRVCHNQKGMKTSAIAYRGGKKNGVATLWDDEGHLDTVSEWKDGWLNGKLTLYEKGKVSRVSHYKEGRLHGTALEWDEHGHKTIEAHYVDGHLEGTAREWYPNGVLQSVGQYKNDALDGIFEEWWDNNKVRRRGQFKDGKKVGQWEYFDKDGHSLTSEDKSD